MPLRPPKLHKSLHHNSYLFWSLNEHLEVMGSKRVLQVSPNYAIGHITKGFVLFSMLVGAQRLVSCVLT